MKNYQLVTKILVASYLYNTQSIDTDSLAHVINNIEGIDRVSIIKEIHKEIMENNRLDSDFKMVLRYLPITGKEFMQLKNMFDVLFVKDYLYSRGEINTSCFKFRTFTEEEMESFLELVSRKDNEGNNRYKFGNSDAFLEFMTIKQFKRYYKKLKFFHNNAYRVFPHHTRETILELLEDNDLSKSDDIYSWAVSQCILTEEDLEPHLRELAMSNACFTKEVKSHYSNEFWLKVFMAK